MPAQSNAVLHTSSQLASPVGSTVQFSPNARTGSVQRSNRKTMRRPGSHTRNVSSITWLFVVTVRVVPGPCGSGVVQATSMSRNSFQTPASSRKRNTVAAGASIGWRMVAWLGPTSG